MPPEGFPGSNRRLHQMSANHLVQGGFFFEQYQLSRSKSIAWYLRYFGGARGVVVIVVGIGHGDTSSNPGRE